MPHAPRSGTDTSANTFISREKDVRKCSNISIINAVIAGPPPCLSVLWHRLGRIGLTLCPPFCHCPAATVRQAQSALAAPSGRTPPSGTRLLWRKPRYRAWQRRSGMVASRRPSGPRKLCQKPKNEKGRSRSLSSLSLRSRRGTHTQTCPCRTYCSCHRLAGWSQLHKHVGRGPISLEATGSWLRSDLKIACGEESACATAAGMGEFQFNSARQTIERHTAALKGNSSAPEHSHGARHRVVVDGIVSRVFVEVGLQADIPLVAREPKFLCHR